jgi:hypothetical protein
VEKWFLAENDLQTVDLPPWKWLRYRDPSLFVGRRVLACEDCGSYGSLLALQRNKINIKLNSFGLSPHLSST